jgi:hypothetical protein
MSKATYQPFIEADAFIAAGGYAVYIQNPTSNSINKYQTSLLNEQSVNTDESKRFFYNVALYGLNESLKSDYQNPKLMLSFNATNELCSVLFYYEVTDMGDPFHWGEAWASKYPGSGSILSFLQTIDSVQMNFYCADNPNYGPEGKVAPYMNEAMAKRPYRSQDPDTKWNKVTVAEIQMAARILLPETQYLPNFAKIVDEYPKTDGPWRYDYNTKTWVDTNVTLITDFGKPSFIPDTFYRLNYDSKTWVINS